jgi:DNA-binding response OmpR family regulator
MRLLVVEDDVSLVAALRTGLGAAGYAVDVAATVAEGSGLLGLNDYDAIVLDLGLPDGEGLALVRTLRAHGDAVPVLVLTARGGITSRVEGLDAGADDYLSKPFAFPELLARLRALLRRGTTVVPTVLRVGDLELDPGRFEVRRSGVPVALTAKEFSILQYFMRHPGEVVTRTMLLEHCWDESYDGLSNLVDVHVSRVRRKLEAAGGSPLLYTVRGAGFVLDERPR